MAAVRAELSVLPIIRFVVIRIDGAGGGAGFRNRNRDEPPTSQLNPIEDPMRENFAGRILKPGDFIEISVIDCAVDWFPRFVDFAKIDDPTELGIDVSSNSQRNPETMAVKPGAFMVAAYHR